MMAQKGHSVPQNQFFGVFLRTFCPENSTLKGFIENISNQNIEMFYTQENRGPFQGHMNQTVSFYRYRPLTHKSSIVQHTISRLFPIAHVLCSTLSIPQGLKEPITLF